MIRFILLGLAIAVPTPAAFAAQDGDITVTASAPRAEIERILQADNLDVLALSAREVADAIARIPRGNAPDDFWIAYQAHVRAWQRVAEIASDPASDIEELLQAEEAVNATFDEVEQIALRYGARMPIPPAERSSTV